MLDRIRQRKKVEIISNLRNQDISNCISDIEFITSCGDVYGVEFIELPALKAFKVELQEEQAKTKLIVDNPHLRQIIFRLEDHPCLRGTLRNLPIESNLERIEHYCDLMYEIWKPNVILHDELVRAYLSTGDYCIHIQRSPTISAERYFFGDKFNWHTILVDTFTNEENRVSNTIFNFLDIYSCQKGNKQERLQSIIDHYLSSSPKMDWRFYFIKYSAFYKDNLVFTFPDDVNFYEMRKLPGTALNSYNYNPFHAAVIQLLNDFDLAEHKDCIVYAIDTPRIIFKNGVELRNFENGFEFRNLSIASIKELGQFNFVEIDNTIHLTAPVNVDRIEFIVKFLKNCLFIKNTVD
jgi:hypothetical protein